MARIAVLGAGVVGLTTAMLLGKDGHEVVVLERDPTEPAGDADALWSGWERRGVNQFRLLHYFQPAFRDRLERELPSVVDALDAAGAIRHNVMALVPEQMSGGFRDDDRQYEALTARRPVTEAALAGVAASTPGVEIRRGVAIDGVLTGSSVEDGTPHIVGVRCADGSEVRADLVIDALGRRSPMGSWLSTVGARPPVEEREDCGFVYYGRYFRSTDGSVPPMIAGLLQDYGSVSILTLPADNGTWGVGIIVSSRDKAARALKDNDVWHRALAAYPLAAHWADGEPIDDGVAAMAGIEDVHRDYCPDGSPVATGVVSIGDAWACTNPSLGRGATIGFFHSIALRDALRGDGLGDPGKFARAFAATTAESVEPWYRATLAYDRARLAEVDAEVTGAAYEPDPVWDVTRALTSAAGKDGEVLRARLRIAGLLESADDVLAAPGVFERILELGAGWRDEPTHGASREEFLQALSG
ncbi:MAG TPA: FAD-dependent oxidoreductase [Mycobacteriales bacterium]|nr:FAD-dependent oxidoreductase [Mycobacteriales bacterium]